MLVVGRLPEGRKIFSIIRNPKLPNSLPEPNSSTLCVERTGGMHVFKDLIGFHSLGKPGISEDYREVRGILNSGL